MQIYGNKSLEIVDHLKNMTTAIGPEDYSPGSVTTPRNAGV